MTLSIRQAAGSLLVVGLSATDLSGLERSWLKLVRPAGIILFRRNITSAQQTRDLLLESTGLCAPHAFRCVDVEGGTVDRLREALAALPSAQAVALADNKKPGLAREHGELVARGISAFGFNTTLAPVLDLALPDSAAVMGTRAAGATPQNVIAFAREFLAGLASQGVVGCGKHFPGLGGGTLDSHLDTPSIRRSLRDLTSEDLVPYRALSKALPIVMVNHAAYPLTPSKDLPATASKFWITTELRNRLGYRGLIFSDDMEMGGILKFQPIEEATLAAIRAGMETLEICHSPELILRAYEAMISAAENSAAFRNLLLSRARDSARKRARMFAAGTPKALTPKQLETLRTRIHRFREKVLALAGDLAPAQNKPASQVETT